MHWTVSAGTLLHLLFYALIVAVSFVCSLISPNDNTNDNKPGYNHFESKYFGENETHDNDKRLIIEDFYRQSSLAAKSIHEMSFRLNQSGGANFFKPTQTSTSHEGNNNCS